MTKKTNIIVLSMLVALICIPYGMITAETKGGVAGDHMFAVSFIDEKEGWACGDRGTLYHTSDGGTNWEKIVLKTSEPLAAISFCNLRVGWVVGKMGTIFHTLDGGKSWGLQAAPKNKYLLTVKALSPEKCWAAGDWGTILYTEDGGKTWQDRTYPKDMIIYDIDFQSELEGWMACELGTILHTKDGGRNWTVQDTGIEATLFGVAFSSLREGLAVGLSGVIIRTEDGGATWKQVAGPRKQNGLSGIQSKQAEESLTPAVSGQAEPPGAEEQTRSLYDVRLRGRLGIAVGDAGKIVLSKDGGKTWDPIKLPVDMNLFYFRGVSLTNPRAVIIGARSIVVMTDDNNVKAIGFLPKIN